MFTNGKHLLFLFVKRKYYKRKIFVYSPIYTIVKTKIPQTVFNCELTGY